MPTATVQRSPRRRIAPLDVKARDRAAEGFGLAGGYAGWMKRRWPEADFEDLLSAAMHSLVRAAESYQDGPVPWRAYAAICVRHAMLSHVQKVIGERPLRARGAHGDDESVPCDRLPCHRTRDPRAEAERSELLTALRHRLPARLYGVLKLKFLESRDLEDVGDLLGVSRETARHWLAEALRRSLCILTSLRVTDD